MGLLELLNLKEKSYVKSVPLIDETYSTIRGKGQEHKQHGTTVTSRGSGNLRSQFNLLFLTRTKISFSALGTPFNISNSSHFAQYRSMLGRMVALCNAQREQNHPFGSQYPTADAFLFSGYSQSSQGISALAQTFSSASDIIFWSNSLPVSERYFSAIYVIHADRDGQIGTLLGYITAVSAS